ncbi:hypothetical protein LEM8419_00318 [Neolewinella maritima]|uniref:5-bromo-4-chloroindolyl phosphate hydrolysis protein n=1 Tax=Neolewinella maritima TaxID=1383882 RepID=A0ABN8F037_9BACT|nr:hypothetical protein [Neolewinella maritima]CAH0999023.1 hypothetical protein LEM8419_00318 [Neolewinella maritima]
MKPEQGPDTSRLLLLAGTVLIIVMVLLRVHPPMAFMAFIIGSTAGFFLLGGRLLHLINGTPLFGGKAARKESEFSKRVAERLADCREREERFRDEGERILKSIATLRDDLARNAAADPVEVAKADTVIKELEAEFSLRHAKASFFADCAAKLRELLDRHRLVESIAARRRELRDLRQTNFDDEAVVEETRFSIEQDTIELDTIVELSNSAASSSKAEQAEHLRDRLEQLRSTLGKSNSTESSTS